MNDTLREQFGGTAPTAHREHCLNARYKAANCTRCVAACPANAIQLAEGQPLLDQEVCIGCGICLHTCPTEVFDQPLPPEAVLMQVGAQLPPDPLAIVCPLHPAPEVTTAPVAAIVRHRRCLAALSPADLLQLSQHGSRTLWLDDSPCTNCPIGQLQATLQQSVRVARTLLHVHEQHPPAIRRLSERADTSGQLPQRRPVFDGSQPKLSRRKLFAQFHARAVEKVASSVHQQAEAPVDRAAPAQRLPQRVPASRIRLLELLASCTPEPEQMLPAGDIPFAAVQVAKERCSGCALCACFCPTGALTFTTADEAFILQFQPALCLDCDICVQACPEDAVQLGEALKAGDLTGQKAYLLVEGLLAPCVDCGLPTALPIGADQRPQCYSCRHGAGVVQPLRDRAGLMADLLKRIPHAGQLAKSSDD